MSQLALFRVASLSDHSVCVSAPARPLISQPTLVVSSAYNGAVVTAAVLQ